MPIFLSFARPRCQLAGAEEQLVKFECPKRKKKKQRRQLDFSWIGQLRLSMVLVLSFNIMADVIEQQRLSKVAGPLTGSLTQSILRVVAFVAAADSYADASAESPSVEAALEDEDEDDEELDAAPSNEYPDGENDNDESYEDADGK